MRNARVDESQAGIKIARRNINHLRYADDTILMAENVEELLMRVKEDSEKAGLKLNIQKTRIMASTHHFMANRSGKVEAITDFIFFGALKLLWTMTTVMKLKDAFSLEEKLWQTQTAY